MFGGKVDFGLIRESNKRELIKALENVSGRKALIWDEELSKSFKHIADLDTLRSHQVIKTSLISSNKLDTPNIPNIIFITRPLTKQMDLINHQLRLDGLQKDLKKEFHLIYVPRMTSICVNRLEQHKVYGTFTTIQEIPVHLFRFESDVASLELPMFFKDLYLEQDPSGIYDVARALMSLQGIFGLIPNIFGKGTAAKQVFDLMVAMRKELAGNEPQIPPQIDQLILIDRAVDLITPLATQLTFEGLLDQFFGIDNCTVKLPGEKFVQCDSDPQSSSLFPEEKILNLNSSEPLFAEIRDRNFSSVGPRLLTEARQVSAMFDERLNAKTVLQMKHFVQKLPQMQQAKQSLASHTAVAELIQEQIATTSFRESLQVEQDLLKGSETDRINPFIEDCIAEKEPLSKVLQLICLQCAVNCGLKAKVLDYYKREILQTYGFEHFLTLENLEKAGLLFAQVGKSTYSTVRKTLRLTVDDVSEVTPTDISYVHSGYAPLSIRMVEFLHCPGWRAITEVLNVLPGNTITETQQLPSALRQRRNSASSIQSAQGETATTLVVFIGGCTYSEISALRFLSSKIDQVGPEYVIVTTKIINGNTFLESLSDKVKPQSWA